MIALLVGVAASMAAKDALSTGLTVAEAKGKAVLAGVLDAAYDVAAIVCTIFGAGEVIVHGWVTQSFLVLGTMCLTSLVGTTVWTTLARRWIR